MTHAKYESLKTETELNRFLRGKMKQKGVHTKWKKYGSWTLTHNNNGHTHIYAWAFLKGTEAHKNAYFLNTKEPNVIFDDMLLLQFNEKNSKDIPLQNSIPLTTEDITDWLECVLQKNDMTKSIDKPVKPKRKTKQSADTKKKTSIASSIDVNTKLIVVNESEDDVVEDTIDIVMDDDAIDVVLDDDAIEDTDDENLDEADDHCSEQSNSDDETGINKALLVVEDDEQDDNDNNLSASDIDESWSDDDNDVVDETDTIYDDNVLQFENYTYAVASNSCPPNTMLSLWTL